VCQRGNLGKFPVVLASATPSIETYVNAITQRYRHVILPGRFSGVEMPDVSAIDLRREAPDKGKWLAPRLVEAMTETFAKAVNRCCFNRRGYAPLTVPVVRPPHQCPQCSAWLVEHRFRSV
jgi:primosomal protein N' (replication factor Y)